ncbi:ParA family protein [Bifidobacterium miconisargentati]|uniref:ParA family protein n=1 Tax=Bifidobacterium miconisargentati TaxID=2834437 RepID=UPI001BDD8082|nr:ParA family protein [Bifidobacterium miconisargentati]MBW3090010.1 ParA family protein [Bifidobacterium miconisargentati]
MKVAIANAKGGVAKTTTAIYLACAAVMRGLKAEVLDADPQSSASMWADLAADNNDPLPFDVVPANLSTLARLDCRPGEWKFIDAPPSGRVLEAAIEAADFVIVPTSDSPLDLQQAWATLKAVSGTKPSAALVVRAEMGTNAFKETLEALDENDTVRFETVVRKRQEIKKSLGWNPTKLYEYGDVLSELIKEVEQ